MERSIKSIYFPEGARLQDFGRLRRAGDLKVLAASGEQTDYVFLLDTIMVLCNKPSIMQQRWARAHATSQIFAGLYAMTLTDTDSNQQ